jgi:hypothetical protein
MEYIKMENINLTNLPVDDVTDWQMENSGTKSTTYAKVVHGFIGALDFQIKQTEKYLNGQLTDNLQTAVTSSNCTDTHEAYIESLNIQMANAENSVNQITELKSQLEKDYKSFTGEDYRPYVKQDTKLLGKQMATASRLEGLEKLKARGIQVDVPALDEVLESK